MKKISNSSLVLLFTKFPSIILGGLLFSLPFAFFCGLFVLLGYLTGFNNIIVWGLGIIPSSLFYSGLVMVVRKISVEKKKINVVKTFFSAVKDNLFRSLLNGAVAYILAACSLFAILYYSSMAKTDVVFGAVLMIYIIFSVVMLIMLFYVPLLTVTYDLKIKDIYKNSLLLIFGKILRNIIALLLVLVVSGIALLAVVSTSGIAMYITIGILVVLYPTIVTYIINSVIAQGVQETVGYFSGDNVQYSLSEEEQLLEQQAMENANQDSDYIFVNGRMVKNPAKDKN